MSDLSLISEGQQGSQEPTLFAPPSDPAVVPKNLQEVAAQLATVDEGSGTFSEKLALKTQDIERDGAAPYLQEVAQQDRSDNLSAMEAHANAAAKAGDAITLENAARMIQAERTRLDPPTTVEGQKALAQRSVEMMGIQYVVNQYKDLAAFDDVVKKNADALSLRNIVAHESAKVQETASAWDHVSNFFTQLLPFVTDYKTNRAISSVTGVERYFDTEAAVNDFRAFFRTLGPSERIEIVHKLAEQQIGLTGQNKAANIELLRKLSELTKSDANIDLIFNSMVATDIGALFKGLAFAVRGAAPLRVLNDVAGGRASGQLAAADLINGTEIGGLNKADVVARLLAAGKNPFDIDPAAVAGMSSEGQRALRTSMNSLLDQTYNRLISSGLTEQEVKDGIAAIKARYAPEADRRIHSVTFGEGSESGQQMTVLWQSPSGVPFASKEAAEAWAKEEGKLTWEAVPKNQPEASFASVPMGTGELGRQLPQSENLLRELKGRPHTMDAAFSYLEQQAALDGEPVSQRLLGSWREAYKGGFDSLSARRVLDDIASQSSNKAERALAKTLLDRQGTIDWRRVGIRIRTDMPERGIYNPTLDKVAVSLDRATESSTLLHELIHAHNSQVIVLALKNKKVAAKYGITGTQLSASHELQRLTQSLRDYVSKADLRQRAAEGSLYDASTAKFPNHRWEAALSHPAELIAYATTDADIATVLRNIKLKDLGYANDERTVFSKVWELFKSILGFRGADDHALAKLYDIHGKLVQDITDQHRTAVTRALRAGDISQSDVGAMVRGGMLSEAGKKAIPMVKALEKEIAKAEQVVANGGGAEAEKRLADLRAHLAELKTPRTPAGRTEEWLVKETRTDPLSVDSIGKFSDEDIRSMPWLAVDPKHGASELAVEERVIGVHGEAKMRKALVDFMAPYFQKLSNAGRRRVASVLEEGDSISNAGGKTGREFSYVELRERGLNDAEAQAYFAARQTRMVSYHLRNAEMVRSLRAEGMREVEFLGTGEKYAGKVLDETQASSAMGKVVWDTVTGEKVIVDSTKLSDAYKAGKRVVQLKAPAKFGDKSFSMVLVDDTTAKARDINVALHYRPGEFSRIYSDQYFIRMAKMAEVDGAVKEVTETVRTAASQREAAEYVEANKKAINLLLNSRTAGVPKNLDAELEKLVGKYGNVDDLKAAFERGELDNFTNMDWHYTRNKEEFLNGSVSEAMANGRLFTSKRSDRLFSVDRDRRNYIDVFDSLQAEIANISRVTNINQWRESMIRRWMNTFGDLVPDRTGNDVADFFKAAGAKFTKGTKEAQFAERTHRYIMRQIGLKDGEQKFYENVTRMVTEKFFTGNTAIESIGAKLRTMSWLNFIRNVNFNLNLGMFNPAQLLVQANGAVTALALSPVHGVKAAYTFPLLRMALMSDNPDVWSKLAKVEKLKNLGLSSEGEFVALVKSIRKAGILDNLKSTALWNMEDGALNVFAGYPRRLAEGHTFFFNRGEEFSRVVSFDVARREWMVRNPGKDWTSDAALKNIVVRMDDLTQNMTKANLAKFQTGALSIPFQFAQYNIKLAANVMTAFAKGGQLRGFTRMEAAQLLAAHVVLYGAAGNGLVGLMDEVLSDETKNSLPVDVKNALSQGLVSWAFDAIHKSLTGEGAKVAIGQRLGSFDYYQRIGEAMFTDPKNVYEALLGPTVSSAKRLGVIGEVVQLWHKDPDLTGSDILDGLSKMSLEQVATLRNGAKAYLFMQHQGKMLDRQGIPSAQLNQNELLWQALGFQPTAAADLNNLIKSKQEHGQALDDIAKLVLRTQRDILTAVNEGDMKKAEEKKKLLQALWPENAGDLMEVQRRVRDKLFPYDTQMQKLLGDYLMRGQTYKQPLIVTQEPKEAK